MSRSERKKIRIELYQKYQHCYWCGSVLELESKNIPKCFDVNKHFATIEHIKSKSKGGTDNLNENLVLACASCNNSHVNEKIFNNAVLYSGQGNGFAGAQEAARCQVNTK
jgi:5-methylcytosine-specific restriction endonuclease McrA